MIEMNSLNKHYGATHVLRDCSLRVNKGEVVVICGPSGSGKSTLIKTINGLEPFQSGTLVVDGISVGPAGGNLNALRARVGMVFQHFELFPHLSVIENLNLAQVKVLGRGVAEATTRSERMLERVGLSGFTARYPAQLSGGQQQRVAIARSLCMDPVVMLFDEPTSALDPEMVGEVLDTMVGLAQDGMTMLCVTHELGFARRVCDRVVFMDQGRILDDCAKDEFFGPVERRPVRAQEFLSKVHAH